MNKFFKKELIFFLGLFIILFLIIFTVLNITGWLIKPPKIDYDIFSESERANQKSEQKCIVTEKYNSIVIPKINIEAPIVLAEGSEMKSLTENLNRGVVIYPSSKMPGENGQTIILGHSAPAGWPKIRYDWVFSDINKLENGDLVHLFWEGCQYNYKVYDKYFLEKGEQLPEYNPETLKSQLILVSCWPPGKDLRRIAIVLDPSPL